MFRRGQPAPVYSERVKSLGPASLVRYISSQLAQGSLGSWLFVRVLGGSEILASNREPPAATRLLRMGAKVG
jgi:hypothetical protein